MEARLPDIRSLDSSIDRLGASIANIILGWMTEVEEYFCFDGGLSQGGQVTLRSPADMVSKVDLELQLTLRRKAVPLVTQWLRRPM